MSALEGGSIPPPGWDRAHPLNLGAAVTPAPVAAPAAPAPVADSDLTAHYEALMASGGSTPEVAAQPVTEAAVRWRMSAATVDNLLVYALYLLICLVLHWRVAALGPLLVLLVLGVVYHFVFESRDGQTPGKRRYGVKVVSVDGGPARPKAIAIRSVLRAIDALPFSYLLGLISLVRTGPERRQRIGDVAAETRVIAVDGRAAERGTPSWVLSVAIMVAVASTVIGVCAVVEAAHQPSTAPQQAQFSLL